MKETRVFIVNDKKMRFNSSAFYTAYKNIGRKRKLKGYELKQELADVLSVSEDTIKGWLYGKNGPSDMEMIKQLSNALNLSDFTLIMYEIDGGNCMNRLTDRQISAVKRIYDKCIWFLHEFYYTDGFNDYWYKFKSEGSEEPEEDIFNLVEGMMKKVNLVLEQEYFDLRNCEIYDELCEFASEELIDIYEGKLGYAYRFEAIPSGHPKTSEDYDKAMIKLNGILEKYL